MAITQPNRTTVAVDRDDAVAAIRLACPEGKPPTLDHAVLDGLGAAIEELAARPPRAVILRSDSPKYFCVGADLNALQEINAETIGRWVRHGHDVFNALEDLPCPVIARVEGYALGGGLELALAADLIYAADSARLGLTEAKMGFIPGWGGSRRLPQRVGAARAKQCFFAGRVLDAREAQSIGLVDHVADAARTDAAIIACVEEILPCSAGAIATFKRVLAEAHGEPRRRNAQAEADHSTACVRDPDTLRRLNDFFAAKGNE